MQDEEIQKLSAALESGRDPLSDLTGRSVESSAWVASLAQTTLLFHHLEHVDVAKLPEVVRGESLMTDHVRYMGVVYYGDEEAYAAIRLLRNIDDALFFSLDNEKAFQGIIHHPGVQHFTEPADFYASIAGESGIQLFHPAPLDQAPAPFVGEGDLPTTPDVTFAFNPNVLEWRSLMPPVKIPLVSKREGRVVRPMDHNPMPPWAHEDSATEERTALVVYGALHVRDASAIRILTEAK